MRHEKISAEEHFFPHKLSRRRNRRSRKLRKSNGDKKGKEYERTEKEKEMRRRILTVLVIHPGKESFLNF